MDFGRVPHNELASINFQLPPEPDWNRNVLSEKKRATKFYVGFPKWGRKEWIGRLYPKGTKDAQFLNEYVKHYNSIELAASHYKLYDREFIGKWADKVKGHEFLFFPKVYQGISHFGSFDDKQFLTDTFLQGLSGFENHLGHIFLQVSDKFGPKRSEELFRYIRSLPKNFSYFLEVRNPEWFSKKDAFDSLLVLLKKEKVGLVITDSPGRRDVAHMHLTIPKAHIRFVANGNHPTDYTRVDEWVRRIKYWVDNGLEELGFFIHNGDDRYSPELSLYIVEQLNLHCNAGLKKPKLIEPSAAD